MMSSLRRCVEAEVLQSYCAELCEAVVNPDVFGQHLVEYQFATLMDVSGIMTTLGFSNYKMTSLLLQIVNSRFRTATSRKDARILFNNFVLIIANHLDRVDIAEQLITSYRKCEFDLYIPPCSTQISACTREKWGSLVLSL